MDKPKCPARLLDMVLDRSTKTRRAGLGQRDPAFLNRIRVVTMDPFPVVCTLTD